MDREKVLNYMLNRKDTLISLISGEIKKIYYKWVNTFQNVKVESDLLDKLDIDKLKNVPSTQAT